MVMQYLTMLWYAFLLMNTALIAHEFGHLLYLRKYDEDAQVVWTGKKTATHAQVGMDFGPKQEAMNALLATLFGMLVVVVGAIPVPAMIYLVPVYTLGCIHDLRIIYRVLAKKEVLGE